VQAALLCHPSISQDQQVVAALQQTSKQLQAAVAQVLQGQLSVAIHTGRLPQAASLVQWLTKHASLLQHLEVQLLALDPARRSTPARWSSTLAGFSDALHHAAAAGVLRLHSLKLKGLVATPYILRQLPPQHLTHLSAEVDCDNSASMQAVAALTGLRSLQLIGRTAVAKSWLFHSAVAPTDVLAPLATALQQLTQLEIEPVTLTQLGWLPPQLQQLHVTVEIKHSLQQLTLLARWMQQRGVGIVRTLKLRDTVPFQLTDPGWALAANALAAAFSADGLSATAAAAAEAVAAPEVGLAAAAAAAAPSLPPPPPLPPAAAAAASCQLQSLTVESHDLSFDRAEPAWPLLQQLPASSLTHLRFCLNWRSTAQTAALLALTALRSLNLGAFAGLNGRLYSYTSQMPVDVLAPLSALQQLTSLKLAMAQRAQLQHLQLPQLHELFISVDYGESHGQLLQLGHFAAVQRLRVLNRGDPFQRGAVVPPNVMLRCTDVELAGENGFSAEPLLGLSCLQKLQLRTSVNPAVAAELVRLTQLTSLQEVELAHTLQHYIRYAAADFVALPAAWGVLPLRALSYSCGHNSEPIPVGLIQQIAALTGLTRLYLNAQGGHVDATPAQLVSMLQQMVSLRNLSLHGVGSLAPVVGRTRLTRSAAAALSAAADASAGGGASSSSGVKVYLDVETVAMLFETVGGMQDLEKAFVSLLVRFDAKEVRQLQDMLQQRLSGCGCYVDRWRVDMLF
jgi:hypothetical protein